MHRFSDAEMERRLKGLRALMDSIGVEAVVCSSFHNVLYYTNFWMTPFGRGQANLVGSRVTYIDEDDQTHEVRIVGYDEADMQRGEISIGSPVARALMCKAAGDGAEVQTPQGVKYLDIEKVA